MGVHDGPRARPSRCVQTAAERRGESVTDIVIAQWCLAHVFHLMVKFQVQQLYNGKYFGSLAKVVNLWRSHGNPKKIRKACAGITMTW